MTAFDQAWLDRQLARPGRVVAVVGDVGRVHSAVSDGVVRLATAPRSEEEEHRAVIAWRDAERINRSELAYLVHVPNGGHRTRAEAGVFRALGTEPGVPDLLLLYPSGPYVGLAIEMKGADARGRLGDLSDDQEVWLLRLQRAGWAVDVCWTASQAIATLIHFLDDPGAFVGGI